MYKHVYGYKFWRYVAAHAVLQVQLSVSLSDGTRTPPPEPDPSADSLSSVSLRVRCWSGVQRVYSLDFSLYSLDFGCTEPPYSRQEIATPGFTHRRVD
eukprot:42793-Prymnesium_polylepis.1